MLLDIREDARTAEVKKMKPANCDAIELEVRAERARQEMKFGPQNHDPFKYLSILGEEVGEAHKAAIESYDWKTGTWDSAPSMKVKAIRDELVQVAAVAKAIIETLDRNTWRPANG